MQEQGNRYIIAGLFEVDVVQEEFAQQRLALEWGQLAFAEPAPLWDYLQTLEFLEYEDKVQVEVRLLEEATATLWRLHKTLAQTRRLLQQQHQYLRYQIALTDL
ncbi:MAG TPA: hypothetical protein VGC99_17420 [Candidatus Tectomicrobia bacterium]